MPVKPKVAKIMKATAAHRGSVTFPPDLHNSLEQIAKQKKVSFAWVVRDAAEKYISDQYPLLKQEAR